MVRKGSELSPETRRKLSEAMRKKPLKSSVSHPHRMSVADSLRVKAEEKRLGVHCIVLTKPVLSRFLKASATGQLLCYKCDELLRVGDLVVSRGNGSRVKKKKRKYFHTHCWESMFFE